MKEAHVNCEISIGIFSGYEFRASLLHPSTSDFNNKLSYIGITLSFFQEAQSFLGNIWKYIQYHPETTKVGAFTIGVVDSPVVR
jgi:hypothetical protein